MARKKASTPSTLFVDSPQKFEEVGSHLDSGIEAPQKTTKKSKSLWQLSHPVFKPGADVDICYFYSLPGSLGKPNSYKWVEGYKVFDAYDPLFLSMSYGYSSFPEHGKRSLIGGYIPIFRPGISRVLFLAPKVVRLHSDQDSYSFSSVFSHVHQPQN
jgi:hypothetical protein